MKLWLSLLYLPPLGDRDVGANPPSCSGDGASAGGLGCVQGEPNPVTVSHTQPERWSVGGNVTCTGLGGWRSGHCPDLETNLLCDLGEVTAPL